MQSIRCVQSALLILVIGKLLHISRIQLLGKTGSNPVLSEVNWEHLNVTGYWLRPKLKEGMGTLCYLLTICI